LRLQIEEGLMNGYSGQLSVSLYRSFRVRTLCVGVTDQVDDGGGA
jgi:hypothetical protein